MSKVDLDGNTITIGDDGLVRIDGVVAFRRVVRSGRVFAQFLDGDRMRSSCRGTRYIEVPIGVLVERVQSVNP